jgi:Endonuclease I/Bacterial Ig-like domain
MRVLFIAALFPALCLADTTPQTVPFAQNWSNPSLITTANDWSGVPGIAGYLGDNPATTTANIDARTILNDFTTLNVTPDLVTVNPAASGGTAEFNITDPVVGIKGSGTADSPNLVLYINNSGRSGTTVSFNARDLDSTATDATQQLNVQYRVGASGNFSNVAGGYFPDVTTINATPTTAVSVTLPPDTDNQAIVQVRIMTTNAGGTDEWLGIDDIQIGTAVDVPPTVASTLPSAGGTVAINANLGVTFSEAVTVQGNWFTLNCAASGAHTATVSGGPANYTLNPSPDFAFGESCTLNITAANVLDQDGTPNAMAADFSLSFNVAPDTLPTVLSTVPANASTTAPIDTNLTVNFSEPVTVSGSWFSISCATSGANTATVTGCPQTYTLNPNSDFVAPELCTVTLIAANIVDQDGLPGTMSSNFVWSFNTASVSDYYASVNASTATTLRTTLHALIDDHTAYRYSIGTNDCSLSAPTVAACDVWDILEAAEQDPADSTRVLDVYRNRTYIKITQRSGATGPSNYNREHTWPNSLGFNDLSGSDANGNPFSPYTDSHMLYASASDYNSDRGNKPYDNCPNACSERVTDINQSAGGGSGAYPGESNWVVGTDGNTGTFEVWRKRKGDMARAILYMDIRYEGGTHANGQVEPDLIVTNDRNLIQNTASGVVPATGYMGVLNTLIAWHNDDPPDSREVLRNQTVQNFQGNRNPFIDRPEWAACLYQNQCSTQSETIFANGFE